MAGGSLFSLIHDMSVEIDLEMAINMACDITSGMSHLHVSNTHSSSDGDDDTCL